MDEQLLPPGEPSTAPARVPSAAVMPEPLPTAEPHEDVSASAVTETLPGVPSKQQQQWGVVISIVIIMLMIIVGAFYAWGERLAENRAFPAPAASGQ